jgi:hypothetical protein
MSSRKSRRRRQIKKRKAAKIAAKAAVVPEQPSFTHFLKLPVEIRENIYEHAMGFTGSSSVLGICSLSKLERSIAIPVYLRERTICLSPNTDTVALSMWLKRVTGTEEKGFATIKKIHLHWKAVNRTECADTIAFLEHLTALRAVCFTVPKEELSCINESGHGRRLRTAVEMWNCLGLAHIASCKSIQWIGIKVEYDSLFLPFPIWRNFLIGRHFLRSTHWKLTAVTEMLYAAFPRCKREDIDVWRDTPRTFSPWAVREPFMKDSRAPQSQFGNMSMFLWSM